MESELYYQLVRYLAEGVVPKEGDEFFFFKQKTAYEILK